MTTLSLRTNIKAILSDRKYLFLIVGVILSGVLLAAYILLTVQPRDIQVVTQYSAIGETHFYKNKWFYLYTFAGFGFLIAAVHSALMIKLHGYERRDLGVMLGWVSIILCFIAARYAYEVMHLAFL